MTRSEIIELYTATFNRAADADGVAYWETQTQLSQTEMANAFVISAEAVALYPATQTSTEYVTAIYNNLFGRAPDADGLAYWVNELDTGVTSKESMIVAIVNGAQGADQTILDNKTAVSTYFADAGLNTTDFALTSVTADAATVTAANAQVDTIVNTAAQAASIQLTSATDSLVGTAANDSWNAAAGTLATADTILDSTSTDADVLYAEVTSYASATQPRLQNIETINMTGKYTTVGLNLASVSGATDLNVNTDILGGTATVENASSINALNINAGANIGTVSVTATASGTRDTVNVDAGSARTVTLIGNSGTDSFNATVATGSTVKLGENAVGDANDIDSFTINTTGGTMTLDAAPTTAVAKNVTINNTGAALTATVSAATVGTATGSGYTIAGTADVTLLVADSTKIDGAALTSTNTGTVTVKITDTTITAGQADLNKFVVDTINLAGASAGAIDVTANQGTVVNLTADTSSNTGTTLNVDNVAGDMATNAGTLLLNVSQNQTINAITTGANVGTVLIQATPDAVTDTDSNSNGIVDTHITVAELDTNTNGATTVVVQGSADLEIYTWTNTTGDVLAATTMTGGLTIGATTAAATLSLGNGTNSITVGNVASTIHGGTGADTITGGTAADTINGGAGNDIIAGGATGANTIDAGSGDDKVTVTAADTVTLGAGNDTIVSGSDLAYTVTDFNVSEDTIVLTGNATAAVDTNLTSVTAPVSNVYKIAGTAGTADFTLTGITTTDLSGFVQLGNTTTAFTAADGQTLTAGTKDDVLLVAGGKSATIATGAGSDTVILTAGATSAVTVTDFTVGTDKIIVTGAATANATVNLASVTPTAGAYTIDTNAVVTLKNAGTAFTATNLTTMVQLGVSATDAYDVSGTALSVTGGTFNDFIDVSGMTANNAATINFIDNGGMDTIIGFKVGGADDDVVSFDGMTGITATSGTTATTTKISDAQDGAVYVFGNVLTTAYNGEKVSTFTVDTDGNTADTILTDVAALLEASLGEADGENYIAIMNDGTNSYAYFVAADADGIQADNIMLIGTVNSALLDAGSVL